MSESDQANIDLCQLLDDQPLEALAGAAHHININISKRYLDLMRNEEPPSEVLGLQRLITLASRNQISFTWDDAAIQEITHTPSLHPLLATALCLNNADHTTSNKEGNSNLFTKARALAINHRLAIDAFMDTQILICADSLGKSKHPDLYNLKTGKVLDIETLGTFLEDIIIQQIATGAKNSNTYNYHTQLGAILFELFENTELHGKLNLENSPIKKNSLRGVIIKRVKKTPAPALANPQGNKSPIDCIEVSIFDSGIGYYSSYTRKKLTKEVSIKEEWRILHTCLKAHFNEAVEQSGNSGHRGMGLYEVLRALKRINGFMEIRTGRVHGYQTFFHGESRLQTEPDTSETRPGMPKPKLLDVTMKIVPIPTEHEYLSGTTVRITVPLK